MNIKFIKTSEKKKIISKLNEFYSIKEMPHLLIEAGKERIRAYSGSLSKEEILQLEELTNLETIGLYFARKESGSIRLSFDGVCLVQNQIMKSIITLKKDEYEKWIRGMNLEKPLHPGSYLIEYDMIPLGVGKSDGKVLYNHVPKDRRLKKPL